MPTWADLSTEVKLVLIKKVEVDDLSSLLLIDRSTCRLMTVHHDGILQAVVMRDIPIYLRKLIIDLETPNDCVFTLHDPLPLSLFHRVKKLRRVAEAVHEITPYLKTPLYPLNPGCWYIADAILVFRQILVSIMQQDLVRSVRLLDRVGYPYSRFNTFAARFRVAFEAMDFRRSTPAPERIWGIELHVIFAAHRLLRRELYGTPLSNRAEMMQIVRERDASVAEFISFCL